MFFEKAKKEQPCVFRQVGTFLRQISVAAPRMRTNKAEAAWEKRFAELEAFQTEHEHCLVPYRHPLGGWVHRQRRERRRRALAAPRAARLDGLGFAWNARDAAWEAGFRALRAYRRGAGHCRVPASYVAEEGPGRAAAAPPLALGEWVNSQRKRYKEGRLSEERRRRLEGIGFVWRLTPVADKARNCPSWEERFQELVLYKEKEGDCNVVKTRPGQRALRLWAIKQRHRHKKGKLLRERFERLADIGFSWDQTNAGNAGCWEKKFQAMARFKEQNGHFNVLKGRSANRSLATWASKQRQAYRNGELSRERFERLEEIGFVWDRQDTAKAKARAAKMRATKKNRPDHGTVGEKKKATKRGAVETKKQAVPTVEEYIAGESGTRRRTRRNTGKTDPGEAKRATNPPDHDRFGDKKKTAVETTKQAVPTPIKQAVPTAEVYTAESDKRRRTSRRTPSHSASSTGSNLLKTLATKAKGKNQTMELSKYGTGASKEIESMQQQLVEARACISELDQQLAAAREENLQLTTEVARREADAICLREQTTAQRAEMGRLAPTRDGNGVNGAGARGGKGEDADAGEGITPFLAADWLQRDPATRKK